MPRAGGYVKASYRDVLDSAEFRQLVIRRWRISLVLTGLLFVLYYGYIILIATNRQVLSHRVGTSTTTGILLAAAVIVGAWLLTAIYVVWANRHYDPDVARLRDRVRGG
jgi:Predicted membrane protein